MSLINKKMNFNKKTKYINNKKQINCIIGILIMEYIIYIIYVQYDQINIG